MLEGFVRRFSPLEILTEAEVDAIWHGILDVLENVGLKFYEEIPRATEIFAKSGCSVDYESQLVKFPRDLVTDCLSRCPTSFTLRAREPDNDIVVRGDRLYVQPGPGNQYLDLDSYEPRNPTRKEFYEAVTVYDALPNLHFLHPNSPNTSFEDITPAMAPLESLVARLRNSTKANMSGSAGGDHEFRIGIAKAAGTNLLWAGGASSPLGWSGDRINGFMAAIEAGFPLSIASGASWGASSPSTIAGSVVSNSAEVMGPLILAQLMHPEYPVSVRLFSFPLNMRNGSLFFGNIATALGNAAFFQVWRRYNIPTTSVEPAISNSKCMDFQSGYEKGILALVAAISGAHTLWLHGTVYGQLTAHPVQAIMDDDISGMLGRFLEGVNVNEETLAIELIKQVGSGPDFYLDKEHTRKWWRNEQFIPIVAEMSTLPEWLARGKKASIDLAKEKMAEIIATHKVSVPLTDSQEEEITRILAEAEKFHRDRGKL